MANPDLPGTRVRDFDRLEPKYIGTAELVDADRCISYQGRVCGYCHDACPFPERALKLVPPAKPVVLDGCVGCGRCVELCPQFPTAIDIWKGTRA